MQKLCQGSSWHSTHVKPTTPLSHIVAHHAVPQAVRIIILQVDQLQISMKPTQSAMLLPHLCHPGLVTFTSDHMHAIGLNNIQVCMREAAATH